MELFSSLSTFVLAVVVLINLLLSYVVYRSNSTSATNRIFVLLGLNITVWLVIQSFSLRTGSEQTVLLLIKLSNFFATPICALFLLLAQIIPYRTVKLNRRYLLFLLSCTAFVMLISLTNLSFSKVDVSGPTPSPTPGPGLFVFMLFVLISCISVGVVFARRLKRSTGMERQQLLFLMLGILSMLGLIITTIIIPILLFQVSSLVPLFPLYTLLFTGATAYSIVRHRLFDIRIIATEIFSVSLWIILLIRFFVQPTGTLSSVVDLSVFSLSIFFGILLIRSVRVEVEQREKLTLLTHQLQQLDLKKNEFINMAAHELRAPLTAIKGFISMVIAGDSGPITDKTKEFLEDSAISTQRMIRLVNNMLNVSRIEEGRITYNMEIVHLQQAASEIYSEFKVEAEQKGLKIELSAAHNLNDTVYTDKDRVQEVIINFVSNAIKYTEKGNIQMRLLNPTPHVIKFEVTDTGPGITEEEQRKLFQKFYRIEAKVGKTIGTGLGLYISKLLVTRFGGAIGVKSVDSKGSTFWFELPIKAA